MSLLQESIQPIVTRDKVLTPRERYIARQEDNPNDTISLLTGEELVDVIFPPIKISPSKRLSSLDALMLVARAKTPDEIGNLPILAAVNTDDN